MTSRQPDREAERRISLGLDGITDSAGDLPSISPSAVAGLRLAASVDLAGIAALALEAVVPAFADAAGVFILESLLQGGGPSRAERAGQVALRRLDARFTGTEPVVPTAAFPQGEVIAFAAGSPYAQSVQDHEPRIFTQPDQQTLEQASSGGRKVFSRYASFLAVPVNVGQAAVGLLTLARAPGAAAFGDRDVAEATRLAAHAGTGITNALTLMRDRAIAAALQRNLLAAEPPQPAQLEVAGRCRPVAGHLVGGDWYDVIPLPAGRTGLVVGDVMGHGPGAAAVMAQLRAAAHALARLDLPPAELLGHLDSMTPTMKGVTLATCVYAVIDPNDRSCTLTAAGHLPPVLAMPDGTTRVPDLPAGQSLGLGSAAYGQARIKLPPGAIIALYTDGLVETRTRSFEQGILAMQLELASRHGPLGAIGDALVGSLAAHNEDDVTLILARIPARTPGQSWKTWLESSQRSN